MQNKYRVTINLNETLQGRKFKLCEVEVTVNARDRQEALTKAKAKAARKIFQLSNLSLYNIEKLS